MNTCKNLMMFHEMWQMNPRILNLMKEYITYPRPFVSLTKKSQPINRRLICTHYSAQELIIVVFSHCKLAMLYVHVYVHVRVRTSVRIPVFLYTRKLATCSKIL